MAPNEPQTPISTIAAALGSRGARPEIPTTIRMQFPNIDSAAISPCNPKPKHSGGKEKHGGEEAECEFGFELLAGCLAGDATPVPDVTAA